MNNRKQILIIIGGIAIAVILIVTNIKKQSSEPEVIPASQKKPEQTAPALLDHLL